MDQKNERALTMLATALKMEEKGESFYDQALLKCANPIGREIFSKLKSDERIHVERIKNIYQSLQAGKAWSSEWESFGFGHDNLAEIFKQLAAKHNQAIHAETGDLEALDIGLDFEQQSVKFYLEHLYLAEDPLEKAFISRMVAEERAHYRALADYKFYLTDPAGWFLENEKASYDGA